MLGAKWAGVWLPFQWVCGYSAAGCASRSISAITSSSVPKLSGGTMIGLSFW